MNGICLCIDRLHAGYLGAYGSTWSETPALDRLAADGFVFDQFLVDSLDLDLLYRSYWFGKHALDRDSIVTLQSLPAEIAGQGARTVLMTDDPTIASLGGAEGFDERLVLPEPRKIVPARSVEATHLGRVFAQIIQKIEVLDGPFFLWCHLSSMGRLWDAPWEMRSRYAEADDPDPPTGADVPRREMEPDEDPDLLLGAAQSYAGQVALLDLCVGALIDGLADAGLDRQTTFALVGLRGLALGEHRQIGPIDDRLHGELVHVPLVFRFPDLTAAAARSQQLVQPPDLYPTWLRILTEQTQPSGLAAADLGPLILDTSTHWRDRVGLVGTQGQHAVRTPAWYLAIGERYRLFAKPDDRWEVNDVADRHADVADRLCATLADYEMRLPTGTLDDLPPMDEDLRDGTE